MLAEQPHAMALLEDYHENIILLAEAGYNAYGTKADWKTYDYKPMPTWAELGLAVQSRWCEAVNAVLAGYREGVLC